MSKGFSRWVYRFTLARWYYNFAWAWIIGYFLSTFTMIVTIYYLIPGLSTQISFLQFLAVAGLLLVGAGWWAGKVLVKHLKVQPLENYISTEVNPFTNATLTEKERVFWNAMVVLLKKEQARSPDSQILLCVNQMERYINGQVEFNFEELDKFGIGIDNKKKGVFGRTADKTVPSSDPRAPEPDAVK